MIKKIILFLFALAIFSPAALSSTDVQFYVSPSGSDAGNTCSSSLKPCATITHAINEAYITNSHGGPSIINLSPGTYYEAVTVQGQGLGQSGANVDPQLIIDGSGASDTEWYGTTESCGTLVANQGAYVEVENLSIGNTALSCGSSLYAQLGGIINVGPGIWFAAASNADMFAEGSGSQIEIWNSYYVFGDTTQNAHMIATSGALIEINPVGVTVNLMTPESYREEFVEATVNGVIYLDGVKFNTTDVYGVKYIADLNGVVFTGNLGCNGIPGTEGGITASGGQCQ